MPSRRLATGRFILVLSAGIFVSRLPAADREVEFARTESESGLGGSPLGLMFTAVSELNVP